MSSDGRQAQFLATWVVKQLFSANKAQSLFAATDGLERKRSSILIRILTTKIQK